MFVFGSPTNMGILVSNAPTPKFTPESDFLTNMSSISQPSPTVRVESFIALSDAGQQKSCHSALRFIKLNSHSFLKGPTA